MRRYGCLALVVGPAVLFCGCIKPSGLRLEQPRLPEPQRRMDLLSEQVYWSSEGAVHRVLAELPLPGAGTGRPMYLLYLRVTLNPCEKGAPAAPVETRGFLIQTRGPQAGLTLLTRAAVTGSPPPRAGQAPWTLQVNLGFEDGSRLSGRLVATRGDWRLTRFETREHTADVRGLLDAPAPRVHEDL